MSTTNLPPADADTVTPFAYNNALVTRIALALSGYMLLILYPAYGLLRGWWTGDFSSFSVGGIAIVLPTSIVFGVFARWTMLKYLSVDG